MNFPILSEIWRLFLLVYLWAIFLGLPFIIYKLWRTSLNVKQLKEFLLRNVYEDEAKIAFLKGDSRKAKDLLDSAYFQELMDAEKKQTKKVSYEDLHEIISRKYERLYYRMSLEALDFVLYADSKNLP